MNLIDFNIKGDERGSLIALEMGKNIPFDINRVYYIFDTKDNVIRGKHAHRNLKQVLIAVSGKCTIQVNDGKSLEEHILNSPTQGLLIEGLKWREMYNFSDGCVLLVLASEYYDEADYIRDYDTFLEEVAKQNDR